MNRLTRTLTLAAALSAPAYADTITFTSNASTANNGNTTTEVYGPSSSIPGSNVIGLAGFDASNDTGGYDDTFTITGGMPIYGSVTVQVPNGVAVQFDDVTSGVGEWLQQFNLGSAVQTFAIPLAGISDGDSIFFAVYGSTQGAQFLGTIVTSPTCDNTQVPEPGTVFLLGFGLLGVGAFARRKAQRRAA